MFSKRFQLAKRFATYWLSLTKKRNSYMFNLSKQNNLLGKVKYFNLFCYLIFRNN